MKQYILFGALFTCLIHCCIGQYSNNIIHHEIQADTFLNCVETYLASPEEDQSVLKLCWQWDKDMLCSGFENVVGERIDWEKMAQGKTLVLKYFDFDQSYMSFEIGGRRLWKIMNDLVNLGIEMDRIEAHFFHWTIYEDERPTFADRISEFRKNRILVIGYR